ncbi:hypothetical protein Acr_01g0004320 [Actinidia rufa]|uniref:Uncharacterized protein n=1 Tax=Actinidia rufa TaxID=165716 RepID=A0A7J0E277_9ERIC|nr:hypothetical protein Acr_01g0004320 [Actinidia rufa]
MCADTSSINSIDLYLDEVDDAWATRVEDCDYVIISSGNWFYKQLTYYEKHKVVGCSQCMEKNMRTLPCTTDTGGPSRLRLGHSLIYRTSRGRTFSPAHFEAEERGGRGSCVRTRLFTRQELKFDWYVWLLHMIQLEQYWAAKREGKGRRGLQFRLMDVTEAMRLRPDGHPNHYGHSPKKKQWLADSLVVSEHCGCPVLVLKKKSKPGVTSSSSVTFQSTILIFCVLVMSCNTSFVGFEFKVLEGLLIWWVIEDMKLVILCWKGGGGALGVIFRGTLARLIFVSCAVDPQSMRYLNPDGEEKMRAVCTLCGKIAYENPKMDQWRVWREMVVIVDMGILWDLWNNGRYLDGAGLLEVERGGEYNSVFKGGLGRGGQLTFAQRPIFVDKWLISLGPTPEMARP